MFSERIRDFPLVTEHRKGQLARHGVMVALIDEIHRVYLLKQKKYSDNEGKEVIDGVYSFPAETGKWLFDGSKYVPEWTTSIEARLFQSELDIDPSELDLKSIATFRRVFDTGISQNGNGKTVRALAHVKVYHIRNPEVLKIGSDLDTEETCDAEFFTMAQIRRQQIPLRQNPSVIEFMKEVYHHCMV